MDGKIIAYMLIFFLEVIEISIYTCRTALVPRGEKLIVAIFGGVGNAIALYVQAYVLIGITEDPFKAVVYALGYVTGTYCGMLLNKLLAIGNVMVTVILEKEQGLKTSEKLRKMGYMVTFIQAKGKEKDRGVLKIAIERKKEGAMLKLIDSLTENAMFIDESIKILRK